MFWCNIFSGQSTVKSSRNRIIVNSFEILSPFQRTYLCIYVPYIGHVFVDTVSAIIFPNFKFLCLPQNKNVLKRRYQKVETMQNTLFGWKTGIKSCISWFIHTSKPIRKKYPNYPKMHNLEKVLLISEDENKIWRNSGISNVYTFSHADFKGVDFYAVR